jgi:hypothetical protein
MTFEEILKKDGLYVADSFCEGFCFEVKEGWLYYKNYRNSTDFNPYCELQSMHYSFLLKDYKQVFTIKSLFKNKTNNDK